MRDQLPSSLTASRITTLTPGIVADVVINEQTDCYGRWFNCSSWAAWRMITTGARDVSIATLGDDAEPAVLVSVVVLTPQPLGGIPANHLPYQREFFRLTATGITPADL